MDEIMSLREMPGLKFFAASFYLDISLDVEGSMNDKDLPEREKDFVVDTLFDFEQPLRDKLFASIILGVSDKTTIEIINDVGDEIFTEKNI